MTAINKLIGPVLLAIVLALACCSAPERQAEQAPAPPGPDCNMLYAQYPQMGLKPLKPPPLNTNLPPMGYNPYNHLGVGATQESMLAAAKSMADNGMRDAGYRFVNIDDGWQAESRDAAGNLVPDPQKFGCGMERLSAYVHGLGMHFGIYTSTNDKTCAGRPGTGNDNVYRDVQQFVKWGVDLVKLDWCQASYVPGDVSAYIAKWRDAIARAGRPMVLMVNAGGSPDVIPVVAPYVNSFRVGGDICASWRLNTQVPGCFDTWHKGIADYLELRWDFLGRFVSPGHFADLDMLQVGNGDLNEEEARSHFSMWAMLSAPLLAGNNVSFMRTGSDPDLAGKILLNREIIAINQDPLASPAQLISTDGNVQYWLKKIQGGTVLAALNLGDQPASISLTAEQAAAVGSRSVTDLWSAERLASDSTYQSSLPPHGVRVLRFSANP